MIPGDVFCAIDGEGMISVFQQNEPDQHRPPCRKERLVLMNALVVIEGPTPSCELMSAHVNRSKNGTQFGEQLFPNKAVLTRKRGLRAALSY